MFESASSNAPARSGRLVGLFAAALLLIANPAAAASFFFDSPSGFGVSAATATGTGMDSITASLQVYSGFLTVTNQAPQLPIMGLPSMEDPNMISTTWTVQNTSGGALEGVTLVLIQPVNYPNATTGLDVSGNGSWRFIEVAEDIYYPAVSLGDLDAGASAVFSFTHLVATQLMTGNESNDIYAPRYEAAVTFVPEPVSIVLLSGVLVGFALWRRQES